MSITRWDPFRDMLTLREAMSNLLEDSYVSPRNVGSLISGGGNLALDVHENANDYTITAALPGVTTEDVDINVLGNTVRIHGEFKPHEPQAAAQPGEAQAQPTGNHVSQSTMTTPNGQVDQGRNRQNRWLVRERRYGTFDRVITLPTAVKAEEGKAQFENGVLTLTLPKVEEAKPRAIKITPRSAIAGTTTGAQSEHEG